MIGCLIWLLSKPMSELGPKGDAVFAKREWFCATRPSQLFGTSSHLAPLIFKKVLVKIHREGD